MGAAARGCLHLVGRSKPLLPQISHIAPPLSVLGSAPPLPPRQAPAWPALPLPAATPGLSRVTETKPPPHKEGPRKKRGPTLPKGATPLEKLGGKLTGSAEAQFLGRLGHPAAQ